MKNELFSIGPFTVYGYGLMVGIGIVVAYLLVEYLADKKKLAVEPVFGLTISCVVGGFIGSKCLYTLTRLEDIIKNPSVIKDVATGWVVYGGIIGGILTAVIYCRIKKMEFMRYLDVAMPAVALAQGLGRIGCFLAGCCYGMETDGWCAVTFTDSAFAPNNVPLVPTQLISSGLDFILFAVLIFLLFKLKAPGQVGGVYLILYSIGRFVLEFFRGDLVRGSVGTLSTSQFISFFTVIAGVVLIWAAHVLHCKKSVSIQADDTENVPIEEACEVEDESKEDQTDQL